MKIIKRLSLLALSGIMALSLGACSSKDPQEEQKKFDRFIEKQFIQQMESDYTTMHVYLKQPQKHGVDPTNVKVNLGERPTIENQHKAAEKAKKVWDEFKEFKRDILSDEQKQDAVNQMVAMTDIAEKEAAAETLLASKGFSEAVVSLTQDAADVVVNAAELSDANRAQIEDIITRKTGVAAQNIVITPVYSEGK